MASVHRPGLPGTRSLAASHFQIDATILGAPVSSPWLDPGEPSHVSSSRPRRLSANLVLYQSLMAKKPDGRRGRAIRAICTRKDARGTGATRRLGPEESRRPARFPCPAASGYPRGATRAGRSARIISRRASRTRPGADGRRRGAGPAPCGSARSRGGAGSRGRPGRARSDRTGSSGSAGRPRTSSRRSSQLSKARFSRASRRTSRVSSESDESRRA